MGKERGGEKTREKGGQLYCIRVLTIPSLPHHHARHKMATSFLRAASAMAVGRWGGAGVEGGVGGMKTLLSHLAPLSPVPPLQLSHFSYSSTPLLCGFSVQQPFFFFFFSFSQNKTGNRPLIRQSESPGQNVPVLIL